MESTKVEKHQQFIKIIFEQSNRREDYGDQLPVQYSEYSVGTLCRPSTISLNRLPKARLFEKERLPYNVNTSANTLYSILYSICF